MAVVVTETFQQEFTWERIGAGAENTDFVAPLEITQFDPELGELLGADMTIDLVFETDGFLFGSTFQSVGSYTSFTGAEVVTVEPDGDPDTPEPIVAQEIFTLDGGPIPLTAGSPVAVVNADARLGTAAPIDLNDADLEGDGDLDLFFTGVSSTTGVHAFEAGPAGLYFVNDTAATVSVEYTYIDVDAVTEIEGTEGDDTLTGDPYKDRIDGRGGNDLLRGGGRDDGLIGRTGADTLEGGDGSDTLSGGAGNDALRGDAGDDNLGGGQGGDRLLGVDGDDTLGGGDGDDVVNGGAGDDVVAAGAGADTLVGGAGNDVMGAAFGDDIVRGGEGEDDLGGGTGRDTINAGAGDDSVGGGEGDDVIAGGVGDDFLAGGGRDDAVRGGEGADTLNGGAGGDTLEGGAGADVFVWGETVPGDTDTIADFEDGIDRIQLAGIENAPGSGLAGRLAALNPTDGPDGARLEYEGQVIRLEGVAAADLDVSDFVFA